MERGAPSTLTGFPNLVEVPTFYMAFRGNSSNVGSQKVRLFGTSFILLCCKHRKSISMPYSL